VGDPLYGSPEAWAPYFQGGSKGTPRLMLQASELEFIHPQSRKPVKIKTREPI
jgi:23S rRNA-/tRNA-specific pseudouridylate synthase